MPYVLAWTIAALPLCLTFGFLSVVTAEILTGAHGLGKLISTASVTVDSTLTFTVVIVLSVMAIITVSLASVMTRRILHWWTQDEPR